MGYVTGLLVVVGCTYCVYVGKVAEACALAALITMADIALSLRAIARKLRNRL